jgi:hypothetical protein
MPEQPQWSERTLDMPPQDPWADAPTTPDGYQTHGYGHGYAEPPTRRDGSTGPQTRPEPLAGTRPASGPPASSRPASAPPASSRPGPAGPGSARPASAPPASGSAPGFPAASGSAPAPGFPAGSGSAAADLPFSAGRASVRPHPRSQPYAAEHEPTGTGWPGAEVPYTRPTMRELRRGGEWTTAALLWAFVCWGIWALSNDGVWATKIIIFVVSLVVAGGLFALSRLVGRIVLEKQFHRVRRSARGSHAVASLFLAGVGLAHLQQTDWVMNALNWVIRAVS